MLIEIISHCYATRLKSYAGFLNYQLSSLLLHPPRCRVRACVCLSRHDTETRRVVDWFFEHGQLDLRAMYLTEDGMSRRAIGRNNAAMTSTADIVWFSDTDQVYRDGVFDTLAGLQWPHEAVMVYPKIIQIHKTHAIGDQYALQAREPRLIDIDTEDFMPKKYTRAIGGVQIVKGDFARKMGYLKDHDGWQTPKGVPFDSRCRDDVAYRSECACQGHLRGISLPGVYRLRHTKSGRELCSSG